jgi:hypothetical protein
MADSNRKGAFQLSDVRQRSLDGFWETASTNAQYGWFAGGNTGAVACSVDRIDFSNDTATALARGNLDTAKANAGVTNTADYSWHAGGTIISQISNISRIQFSNDTAVSLSRGALANSVAAIAGTGNTTYGWFAGGGPAIISNISRLIYASDTTNATSRGNLSVAKYLAAGSTNGYYGWISGGVTPATSSSVDRLDFSNDNLITAVRGSKLIPRYYHSTVGNSGYSWIGGGYGAAELSSVERSDYSNDLQIASARSSLSSARQAIAGSSNTNYGWFAGGNASYRSTVDRVDFSNDTLGASIRGPLSTTGRFGASQGAAGIANYPQYPGSAAGAANATINGFGWVTPLNSLFGNTSFERIDFSNDSVAASARGSLAVANPRSATAFNNSNYGFLSGGTGASLIERLDFANDLLGGRYRGSLAVTGNAQNGSGNANYGWLSGGTTPNSDVQRIDFSNDISQALPRGTLVVGRYFHTATGNVNYGWHASGLTPGAVSSVERIVYANDLTTAVTRGSLLVSRDRAGSTSNTAYGWFVSGGFSSPVTSIDRVDFSNDSGSAVSRGNVPLGRAYANGAGNANYGWFSGGYAPPSYKTTVDRIDYANDTATATTRGPLTVARSAHSAASPYVKERQQPFIGGPTDQTFGSFGWFTGGWSDIYPSSNPVFSSVERIDFSNDLTSTSTRGTLGRNSYGQSSTGNLNYGWFAGGKNDSPTNFGSATSSVSRIIYSNDTVSASSRSALNATKISSTAVGNANYGWIIGGVTNDISPNVFFEKTVERIDFSNDSSRSINFSVLLSNSGAAAVGNLNYGWVAGGLKGPDYSGYASSSLVYRIEYSNDTNYNLRSGLTVARHKLQAVGNTNYGWFVGGVTSIGPPPGPNGGDTFVVDRIDYSNDTTMNNIGSLPSYTYFAAAAGNSNYGWFGGGDNGSVPGSPAIQIKNTVLRLDFSNSTFSTRNSLNRGVKGNAATSDYIKMLPQLNVTQYNIGTALAGTAGAGSYGWFGGGAPAVSTVNRLDFTNDTVAAGARTTISAARYLLAATNNTNYGWFAGGYTGGASPAVIDRVDYSNDAAAALARGNLPGGMVNVAAAGNANFGLWAGGNGGLGNSQGSAIYRLTYSNDLANAISGRATLLVNLKNTQGISNASYSWFGGGYSSGAAISSVARIDLGNDTITSTRGPLSSTKDTVTFIGNSYYGWIAGNKTPNSSILDRINYSNDLVASLTRGTLSIAKYGSSGASNQSYGWVAGGFITAGANQTAIDRVDFSNDLLAAPARGALSISNRFQAGASNYVK